MELTSAMVAEIIGQFQRRVEIIKTAGGVPHMEVVERRLDLSETHYLDEQSFFWIPSGVAIVIPPPRPPG